MKVLTGDGIELFVERSGKGVPCIYLHGGPGYWSKSFQHFAGELLEDRMEMIYLDQRGCGRSLKDVNGNYSLTRLVDDLEDVRRSLGINKWYVMGHSFGGIVAVNYAYKYASRTEGIILSNATLNMVESFSYQIKKGMDILNMHSIQVPTGDLTSFMKLFYSVLEQLIESGEYFHFQFKNLAYKEKMDMIDKDLRTDPSFQQYIFSHEEYFQDFTKLTDKINLPVLIVTGKRDDAIGPNHYQKFEFNHAKVCELDTGHHPYVECIFDFNKAITEFVEKL